MVHRIHDLIERFPEDIESVRALIASDHDFDVICDEYQGIAIEIRAAAQESGPEANLEVKGLKMRRVALEEMILTKIEGYKPV